MPVTVTVKDLKDKKGVLSPRIYINGPQQLRYEAKLINDKMIVGKYVSHHPHDYGTFELIPSDHPPAAPSTSCLIL